eukprot:SAG11_NODE_1034_length_6091_cov_6.237984_6_plen_109_part_00
MLWTLQRYGAYVVDGGAGEFNMAFEAGPAVSMDGTNGAAAADIARAYNLTDGTARSPPDFPFTALRVDLPGSDWSKDVELLEHALHLVTSWGNATYARVARSGGKEGA